MFDPTPIKVPNEIFQFMQENRIKHPTKYALIMGGFYIAEGFKPIFEAKFDRIRVDIFTQELKLVTEIDGKREPEQSKADGKRDHFLVLNNTFVHRVTNQQIIDFIPKNEQVRYSMKGVIAFIEQLQTWKKHGIPNYHQANKNENTPNISMDDINDWFDKTDWLN